jgi:2-polyprenyl-3-methyl-5-hydroxy-6-metoxy-1,4-benzoquinol methylase
MNSKRGMKVIFCNNCGLFESISTKEYESRPPGNLSCDADRSSVKYTKTLKFDAYEPILKDFFHTNSSHQILDVGSNRGTFIDWIRRNGDFKNITAIETDFSITEDYRNADDVTLHVDRFENISLESNSYDYAYCVHTLEHALSAYEMLEGIFNSLKIGGIFFLAVPNLTWDKNAIVEYFIDPHTFHFDHKVIENFLKLSGFSILYSNTSEDFESNFVLRKESPKLLTTFDRETLLHLENASEIKKNLEAYKIFIQRNRAEMQNDVQVIKNLLDNNKKVFFWGAGCIFDAISKFGDITPSDNLFVIDKFLPDVLDYVGGFKIHRPSDIELFADSNSYLYIASRDYKDQITAEASHISFKKIFSYGEDNFV